LAWHILARQFLGIWQGERRAMSSSELIGARIKNYRERLGLSIEELAKNAGVDSSLIGRIEEGKTYPPIGVMVRLARALGQRLGTFMDDQVMEDPLIVRLDERREETSSHNGKTSEHYHYFPLAKGKPDRHMEPFFIIVEPCREKRLSSHEGEEFIVVVSGEVELIYGKEKFLLRPGDTMHYNSIVPHHLGAAGDKKAEIYAVIYMPI